VAFGLKLHNAILTPHTAYNTVEAMENCTEITIENIEAFISRNPINILNPGALKHKRQIEAFRSILAE
jgi:phosphoglycerate dehydrogenase-like enzyme